MKSSVASLKKNRKIKVFLFFIVLTSIIWLLMELSKSYTSTVTFSVKYVNLPEGKLLQSTPVNKLDIDIKAPGFTLLKYKISEHPISLNLGSLTKKNKKYYFLPNKQLSFIKSKLSGDVEPVSVLKDTIFIDLGVKLSKKVPVKPTINLAFKLGYNLVSNLQITPDSITISGPQKYVDSIQELSTSVVNLEDIHKDIRLSLPIQLPAKKTNVKLSASKVAIEGKVEKFTEGSFTIPVTFINKPDSVSITPLPKEIEVIYQTGLSNFNKINEKSFLVVFDYKQYENDTSIQFLTPKILQKSDYIYSLKVNPNKIEFLIQK
ncbi:CdaR family protein [Lutibacter sp.]